MRATPEIAQRRSALIAPLRAEAAEQLASRYTAKEIDQLLDVIRQARQLPERHVERLGLMLKAPA